MKVSKKISLKYFAVFRELAQKNSDEVETFAEDIRSLYEEVAEKYQFTLRFDQVRIAINEQFCLPDTQVRDGDTLVFIPPVAGG